MKLCKKCSTTKDLSDFARSRSTVDGCRASCKLCVNKYRRESRLKNPEHYKKLAKRGFLKQFYGITDTRYYSMLKEQQGKCAICKNPETRKDHRSGKLHELSVDHCHLTNKIRGLLCVNCNQALGLFKNSALSCTKASMYLLKSEGF